LPFFWRLAAALLIAAADDLLKPCSFKASYMAGFLTEGPGDFPGIILFTFPIGCQYAGVVCPLVGACPLVAGAGSGARSSRGNWGWVGGGGGERSYSARFSPPSFHATPPPKDSEAMLALVLASERNISAVSNFT